MRQPQSGPFPGIGRRRHNRPDADPKRRAQPGPGPWAYDPDFGPTPQYFDPRRRASTGLGALIIIMLSAIWFLITLPFRLVFGIISLMGRLAGVGVGFSLMVVGMALLAGPFALIGFPLFLVGLFLTLRCLG